MRQTSGRVHLRAGHSGEGGFLHAVDDVSQELVSVLLSTPPHVFGDHCNAEKYIHSSHVEALTSGQLQSTHISVSEGLREA